jgi:hypothetical protein
MVYLITTSVSLVAAWALTRNFGLRGTAVALIGGELFMAMTVLRASLRFLGDSFGGFARSMFSMPKLRRSTTAAAAVTE